MSLKSDDISRLYATTAKSLLRFFLRRSLQVEVAMDLVAETFAKAFIHRADFRGDGERAEVAWIYGIARNELSEYFRRGLVERRALQKLGIELGALSDADYDRVEELAGLQHHRDAMAVGLNDLPLANREAVRLRVVEERSYAEMACVLGITEQTARARVSRGLRTLARTTRGFERTTDLG